MLESSHYMEESDVSTAYFLMPDVSFKSLHEELEIIMGENKTADLLYRLGYRCGEGAARDTVVDSQDFDTIEKFVDELPEHWIHIGLSSIEFLRGDLEDFYVSLWDTLEAKVMRPTKTPSCQFTKGFLEGVISVLFNKKYTAREKKCIAMGDDHCEFHVKVDTGALTPDNEELVKTSQKYELMKGMAYMVKHEDVEVPFRLFKYMVIHGHQGLIITRLFPHMIRDSYDLKKSSIIWLSRDTVKEIATIQPGQLGLLHHKIHEFLKKSEKGVVLLDGVEYLITQNSFSSVLKVIQLITGKVALFGANLVVPLNPNAFEKKDFSLFSREFRTFSHPDFEKTKVESIPTVRKEEPARKKETGSLSMFSKMLR